MIEDNYNPELLDKYIDIAKEIYEELNRQGAGFADSSLILQIAGIISGRLDAEVKHEIAEEETIVIWGEPLRKKKSKTLDDYSDCKLPKLPEDCDATESDIY